MRLSPLPLIALVMSSMLPISGCGTTGQHAPSAVAGRSEVLYLSNRDGDYEIYLQNLTTGVLTKLTDNDVTEFGLAWSPDGTTIAFGRWIDDNRDLYTMRADGSDVTRLTEPGSQASSPDCPVMPSPDVVHPLLRISRSSGCWTAATN